MLPIGQAARHAGRQQVLYDMNLGPNARVEEYTWSVAVDSVPSTGMMSVFDGEPTYCAFGFEKTKDEKDVLSLRTWETFQEELTEDTSNFGSERSIGGDTSLFDPSRSVLRGVTRHASLSA